MTVDTTRRAVLRVEIGAPGTGKSRAIVEWLRERRPSRLLIVDPDGEHSAFGFASRDPVALTKATQGARFAAVFSGTRAAPLGRADFAWACKLAQARAPCVFVVDELADFVRAGESETPWGWIVRHGRKYGLEVVVGCQRPALLDKSLWSMATWIRSRRLNYAADHEAIGAALAVDRRDVAALAGFDWIARDCEAGKVLRSREIVPESSSSRPAGRLKRGRRAALAVVR
jgi:hypothetical protein